MLTWKLRDIRRSDSIFVSNYLAALNKSLNFLVIVYLSMKGKDWNEWFLKCVGVLNSYEFVNSWVSPSLILEQVERPWAV